MDAFPPRVKRPTAELIESFKVIGIDNAPRVNKSYERVRRGKCAGRSRVIGRGAGEAGEERGERDVG